MSNNSADTPSSEQQNAANQSASQNQPNQPAGDVNILSVERPSTKTRTVLIKLLLFILAGVLAIILAVHYAIKEFSTVSGTTETKRKDAQAAAEAKGKNARPDLNLSEGLPKGFNNPNQNPPNTPNANSPATPIGLANTGAGGNQPPAPTQAPPPLPSMMLLPQATENETAPMRGSANDGTNGGFQSNTVQNGNASTPRTHSFEEALGAVKSVLDPPSPAPPPVPAASTTTEAKSRPKTVQEQSNNNKSTTLTKTPQVQAANLGNRDFVLARPSTIACVLETQIFSNIAGNTICVVTQDVYSSNGRVLIIEKGSKISGAYSTGLSNGDSRLAVVWERVLTTKGIVLDVEGPGADSVGGAGTPGYVDNHWPERIGAALLLSFLEDVVVLKASSNGSVNGAISTNSFGATQAAIPKLSEKVLDKTINIAPTLIKNRGETITVMVNKDIWFDQVYDIERD